MFGLLLSRHAGVMFSSTTALVYVALQGSPDTRQVASITVPPARPVCQYNPQPTAQVMQLYIINCTLPCIGATCAQSFARWHSALYGHRYAVAAQRAPRAHCCELSSLVCSALCKHKNISCMAKLSADNCSQLQRLVFAWYAGPA